MLIQLKLSQLKLVTERVMVKKENITGLSQDIKETRHKPEGKEIKIIHYENHWKKKKV